MLFTISLVGNYKVFLFCPSLLLIVVLLDDLIKDKKKQAFFRACGNLTYPLYLLHFPIMISIILISGVLGFSENIYTSVVFFLIFFFGMITISYFSYRYFEDPLNRKIRKKYK